MAQPTALYTIGNPYLDNYATQCQDLDLPVFPTDQDCTNYPQLRSQIAGLIILPNTATAPTDWQDIADWTATIDNTDTTGDKARYLVGKGSFLPQSQVEVNLAGGRVIENRERAYRLTQVIYNMDEGHWNFGRKLQNNLRNFRLWLETLGGRLIGGASGIKPFYVNADFTFGNGNDDREAMVITMDFFLPNSRELL